MKTKEVNISELQGLTITKMDQSGLKGSLLYIETAEGRNFRFMHYQDCCESVTLEDVDGDFEDVMYSPVLLAEEVEGNLPQDFNESECWSYTWTFYKIRTNQGSITLRFFGESNGYYSESVNFEEVI